MADKPAPAPSTITDREAIERIIGILALVILISALITSLVAYLQALLSGTGTSFLSGFFEYFLENIWPVWKFFAFILSVLCVAGIIYSLRKLSVINEEENKIFNPDYIDEDDIVEPKNERWEKILKLANSPNSSDWRMAIIEADTMLEELLRSIGYQGESLGDMLRSVDKTEFLTIEDAWEAHKMRNAVAHSGGTFRLNERETKHTVSLFEKVFNEFDVI